MRIDILSRVIPSLHDPIVALATPAAPSALAVIRTSGSGCLPLISRLLKNGKDLRGAPANSVHHCVIRDGDEDVDEVIISVFKAPKSYTGEDCADISCHGSLPVIQRLVSLLSRSGFRHAEPGEFTERAFLNGKMDLTAAEAVNEIARAKTDKARSLAMQRLSGAIESAIKAARDRLLDLRAAIEVQLDYPEEETGPETIDRDLEEASALLEGLSRTYRRGRIYQEGAAVAIAGATNSGKSSLFNLLLKQERAIVSDVHGTTRDWLEGTLSLEGIPVRLFDTAGIRDAGDEIEAEGIKRTRGVMEGADLVLYLVDSQIGIVPNDAAVLGRPPLSDARVLKVWNKIDLPQTTAVPEGFVPISSLTSAGIDALEAEIERAILGEERVETGGPLIDSERQRDLIDRARASLSRFREDLHHGVSPDLLAVDLADALEALGEITGEVTSAEILERMFSRFCVGK
jgi:tRNA modification GTPase